MKNARDKERSIVVLLNQLCNFFGSSRYTRSPILVHAFLRCFRRVRGIILFVPSCCCGSSCLRRSKISRRDGQAAQKVQGLSVGRQGSVLIAQKDDGMKQTLMVETANKNTTAVWDDSTVKKLPVRGK